LKKFNILINSKRFFYRIISLQKFEIYNFNEINYYIIEDNYFKNPLNKLIYYYIIIDIFSLKIYNDLIQNEENNEKSNNQNDNNENNKLNIILQNLTKYFKDITFHKNDLNYLYKISYIKMYIFYFSKYYCSVYSQ
jgi:hypothetical protein